MRPIPPRQNWNDVLQRMQEQLLQTTDNTKRTAIIANIRRLELAIMFRAADSDVPRSSTYGHRRVVMSKTAAKPRIE